MAPAIKQKSDVRMAVEVSPSGHQLNTSSVRLEKSLMQLKQPVATHGNKNSTGKVDVPEDYPEPVVATGNLTDSLPCGDGQIAIFRPSGPIEQNRKKLDILEMNYSGTFYRDKPFKPAILDLRGIFTDIDVMGFDIMVRKGDNVGGRRFMGGYTEIDDEEEYTLDNQFAKSSSLDMLEDPSVNWRIEVPCFYDPTSLGFHCVGNCAGVENPSEPVLLVHGWDPEVEIVKKVFEWLYFQAPPMLDPNPTNLVVFTDPDFIGCEEM